MSVAIFKGKNAKLLTSGELENGDGQVFSKYVERNYIVNPSGAVNTSGWTATGTMTVTRVTSSLPRTSLGYGLQFASGAAADYVRYRFTIDSVDQAKKLKIALDMVTASYTSGDIKVDLYATSDSSYATGLTRQVLSTDVSAVTSLPTLSGTFRSTFDASSSLIYCELRIVRVAGTSTITLSDVVVGPGAVTQGPAVGDAVSWTPTGSWSTNTTYTGQYWRRGARGLFNAKVALSGAPTSASLTINMPTGLTINSSLVNTTLYASALGTGGSNLAIDLQVLSNSSTSSVLVAFQNLAANTGANVNVVDATHPVTWASTNTIDLWWDVPVNEWAGSGTVNIVQNDLMYAWNSSTSTTSDTTSFGYGPVGVNIQAFAPSGLSSVTKRARFQAPVSATPWLEVYDGANWVKMTDRLGSSGVNSGGTAGWGVRVAPVSGSSTDFDVLFLATFDGNSTDTWSGLTSWKWRLVVGAPGQAVGFGIVQPGFASGLVSASGVPGNTTGNAIATGYVGEVVSSSGSLTASGSWSSGCSLSISLTAGVWDICGSACGMSANTGGTFVNLYISTTQMTSGSATPTGTTKGYDFVAAAFTNSQGVGQAIIPRKTLALSSTTTVFIGARSDYTQAGDMNMSIVARRIA